MFSNYRSYYNKEPEQRCMTDHRIKYNSLSSFENKQRSFSNIRYGESVGPTTLGKDCCLMCSLNVSNVPKGRQVSVSI
jgi:hypothetical protein